ncbi:MAG: Gfo/Idh/MocA family oxidoreductase [Sphingobacteriales bacterium]|mgnify:CR=1 FL=1|nr:Gfo/Idh/MocA family oxidoreductase [Sphingobacteriales bacterium]OJW32764.1 MAG: oxidoreductase [Sphingobacteriales bacterium 46-32]
MSNQSTRRNFIRKMATGVAGMALAPEVMGAAGGNNRIEELSRNNKYGPADTIRLALIGAGGMGLADANTAITVPGVKLVAVCDLYEGRLADARKIYGNDIFTTRDYKEILQRKDIDAVIVATPDHWHKDISIDAMNAGKAVYCEKPMVHDVSEGAAVVEAQNRNKVVFQVGSQGLSSLGNEKAKELLAAGAIGKLNYAEGFWARNSPEGAWQYRIPEDGNDKTVDWKRFLNKYPQIPFDAKRFFRWRCYKDYGTGVSGDLFVHLFSSLHFITNSKGPQKIMAMGGLRFWKDGREVPDVLMGMFDYAETPEHPAFNLSLRVNFVDGTADSTYLRLVGNEGSMNVEWDRVTLTRNKAYAATDDPLLATKLNKDNPLNYERKKMLPPDTTVFNVEKGYKGAHFDHFFNFFTAIREKKLSVEDALFGYRAAAPALLCNDSYFTNKPVLWDPVKLKVVS